MIEVPPPPGPAWEHAPTRENVRGRARRLRLWLIATVAAAVAVVPICVLLGVPALIFVAELLLVLLALPLEATAMVALRRTERVLRTYGWEAFPASFDMISGGAGQRVTIEFAQGHTAPFGGGLLNRSPKARSRRAHPELVWFAGDRRFGGVTSPVGGGLPVLLYRQRRAKGKAARGTAEADALARKAGLDRASSGN
ncbi:hypothetical protein [Spirillospora sp. CA-128828]|uniref:hypothetical protein n=1 Tax=Spirillospora sp. CA-128828 TaxID=3240033 RepID=UPI003D8BFBA0